MNNKKLLHEQLREFVDSDMTSCEICEHITGIVDCFSINCRDQFAVIADEIEREYIPLPRFDNGEPVSKGCEVKGGIVAGWSVCDDGAFTLNDEDGNILQEAEPGEFVKRPTPKVYDADGVEIKIGDTIYNVNSGVGASVIEIASNGRIKWKNSGGGMGFWELDNCTNKRPVFDAEGVMIRKGDTVWHANCQWDVVGIVYHKGEPWVQLDNTNGNPSCSLQERRPETITHREPDSLEKLRDEMRAYADGSVSCIEDDLHMFADRLTALIDKGI